MLYIMETIIKQKIEIKNYNVRSPTLQTVMMVEAFIKENSGEFRKTELFNKLPKKVMWGTFQIIIKYLEDVYRIILEKDGTIVYIWNPEFYEKIKDRPEIKI